MHEYYTPPDEQDKKESGFLPWMTLGEYEESPWEANLCSLKDYHPNFYKKVIEYENRDALRIRRTEKGVWEGGIKNEEAVEPLVWEYLVEKDGGAIKEARSSLTPINHPSLLYLLGMDMGFTLNVIRPYSQHANYKGFIVVEPRMELFLLTMAVHPMTDLFASDRWYWIVGEGWEEKLRLAYRENSLFVFQDVEVFFSATGRLPNRKPEWVKVRDLSRELKDTCRKEFEEEIQETQRYYLQKDPARIERILAVHFTGGMAVRYIQERFLDECRKQGKGVVYYQAELVGGFQFLKRIAKEKPDLLLFMNWSPSDYVPEGILNSLRIPRMTWCIDDPNSFLSDTVDFSEHDFVFTWDDSYRDVLERKQARSIDLFPYVADLDGVKSEEREELKAPVSYIGQVCAFRPETLGLDDKGAEFVQFVARRKCDQLHRTYNSLVWEFQNEFNMKIMRDENQALPRNLRYAIYIVANALRRIQVLDIAREFGLKLYGNEDWLEVLGEHPLRACYQGPADPREDVPPIFRSSQINLNIHSIQALTSLNQRDFNCPLMEGFLLTDWVEGADRFFVPGEELVFYHDLHELKTKLAYYLDHDDKRLEIIQKGKRRVEAEHTYSARVPHVLQTLKQRIQERYGDVSI